MGLSLPEFRNILVATDFSPAAAAALEQGLWAAKHWDANVTVAHVIRNVRSEMELMAYGAGWGPVSEDLDEWDRRLREEAAAKLDQLAAAPSASGVRLQKEILVGVPFVSIIQAVEEQGYDLVVVGTRGLSTLQRAMLGSTATRLARKCPCPLWIARAPWTAEVHTILATVDFSDVSGKVLLEAAAIAERSGAALQVLHVYDDGEMYAPPPLSEPARRQVNRYLRQMRRQAQEQLAKFVDSFSLAVPTVTQQVSTGVPWRLISATAKRLKAGLIVMGSVGRSGIGGLLFGNTAERVLHAASQSILVLKPDSFVSPVLARQAGAGHAAEALTAAHH